MSKVKDRRPKIERPVFIKSFWAVSRSLVCCFFFFYTDLDKIHVCAFVVLKRHKAKTNWAVQAVNVIYKTSIKSWVAVLFISNTLFYSSRRKFDVS